MCTMERTMDRIPDCSTPHILAPRAAPGSQLGNAGPAVQSAVPLVQLRLLQPGETKTLVEIFEGLSHRSRERRFLAPVPRLMPRLLRVLAAVEDPHHVALVAETEGGSPIGISRFVRAADDDTSADVGISVVDSWQGRGVGRLLAR